MALDIFGVRWEFAEIFGPTGGAGLVTEGELVPEGQIWLLQTATLLNNSAVNLIVFLRIANDGPTGGAGESDIVRPAFNVQQFDGLSIDRPLVLFPRTRILGRTSAGGAATVLRYSFLRFRWSDA